MTELTMKSLEIPFRVEFQHSSASRAATETVLVTIKHQDKEFLGEGCPRAYVTGETVETALVFFESFKTDFEQLESLNDLRVWMEEHPEEIDRNPAAFCAVEMALLGYFTDELQQSVEGLLGLPELQGEFFYTAVIGASSQTVFEQLLGQYLKMGFTDFKIKLFGDEAVDIRNAGLCKARLGPGHRIRIDANNLWEEPEQAVGAIEKLSLTLFAVEEPMAVGEVKASLKVAKALGTKIILDESFNRLEQLDAIKANPESWIVNLRVSKMGGLLRSLEIANHCRKYGIPLVIGAQVGETSLLTRAALTVANCSRDILISQEGGFGTFLLEKDLLDPPLMFGPGGRIRADEVSF